MLRIKECFNDCGISQAQLVKATGWSKALISRVFKSGELPVDSDKFTADVVGFAEGEPKILEWCKKENVTLAGLLEPAEGQGAQGRKRLKGPKGAQSVDVDGAIIAMAGRVALNGSIDERQIFSLGRTALFLLETLRASSIGMDELGEIEVLAGRILLGGEA